MDPVEFVTNLYDNLQNCDLREELKDKLRTHTKLTDNEISEIANKVLLRKDNDQINFTNKTRAFWLFRPFVYLYKIFFGESTKSTTNYYTAISNVRNAVNSLKNKNVDDTTYNKMTSLVDIVNSIIRKVDKDHPNPINLAGRVQRREPDIPRSVSDILREPHVAVEIAEPLPEPLPEPVVELIQQEESLDEVEPIDEEEPVEDFTELQKAAFNGDLTEVQKLLEAGVDVNKPNSHGTTPLHYACFQGNLEIVKELLKHDADVNYQDIDGATPLHTASQNSNSEITKLLIENKADVNAEDKEGNTPLYYAWQAGDVDSEEELLKSGAHITTHNTVLHDAINNGLDLSEIRRIIETDKEAIHQTDEEGNTPLNIACKSDNLLVIRELLENDADPDYWNVHGDTALHTAIRSGASVLVVKELLRHNALPFLQNNDGNTPLHLAVDASEAILRELIEISPLDSTNKQGETPLHLFIEDGDIKKISMLIERGAPLNDQNIRGETPLHYACILKDEDAVKELLKHVPSLNLNVQDINGITPLHYAYRSGNKEIIDAFIRLGADRKITDNQGKTAEDYSILKPEISEETKLHLSQLEQDIEALKEKTLLLKTQPFGEFLFNATPSAKDLLTSIQNFDPKKILESEKESDHPKLMRELRNSVEDFRDSLKILEELRQSIPPDFQTILQNNPNKKLPDLMAIYAYTPFEKPEELLQGYFDKLWDKIKPNKGEKTDRTKEKFDEYKTNMFNFFKKNKSYWNKLSQTQRILTSPKYQDKPAMLRLAISQFKDDFLKCMRYDKQIGTRQLDEFNRVLMDENNKTIGKNFSKHVIRESLVNKLDRRQLKSDLDGQEFRYDSTIASPKKVEDEFRKLEQANE